MSAFEQELRPHVAILRAGIESDVPPAEVVARMCWSCVIEAGDGSAGQLIRALGAESIFRIVEGDTAGVVADLAQVDAPLARGYDWASAFERWQPRCNAARIVPLIAAAGHLDVRFVVPGDDLWPTALDDLGDHAPVGIWVRGNLQALGCGPRSLSIVGSRASTHYGNEVTGSIAVAAADAGLTIVSGGAYGIDARAHRVALASEAATVAILAGGVDQLYPASNHEMFVEIMRSGGAVLAETPVGQRPARWRFLQRNRLIAAMTPATIVVEAGARSGALSTANHALELGRELGAVPGAVTSASSVGCHNLIRRGAATLVTSGQDALELWRLATGGIGAATEFASGQLPLFSVEGEDAPGGAAARVRDALPTRGALGDAEIAALAGLSLADTRLGLSQLEMEGTAELSSAGWRRVRSTSRSAPAPHRA